MFLYMNSKNEPVSIIFGSSADRSFKCYRASPLTPTGALPLDSRWGLRPQTPYG